MPIYEYKCKKCGEKFELRLDFFHNKKLLRCPKCGSENPERVYSPFQSGSSNTDSCSSRSFG